MIEPAINKKRFTFYLWVGLAFLIFWLFHAFTKYEETFSPRAANEFWRVLYVTILNYFFLEYALTYIGKKRKTVLSNILIAIPVLFVFMMLYSWGLYAWRNFGIALHIFTPFKTFPSVSHAVSEQMGFSVSSIFFFAIIRHIYNYQKLKQATQLLRIEKQQAELNYLKSQTNPHFLFNTLNNIYALAREKSDLAPESILRLSKILRFMLYETSGAFISIEQELKVINDYIALEKLRYDESLRIYFNHDVEDMKQALPPLLLIPLVENAFKHGVSETRGDPYVDIHLSVNKRNLLFTVKNSSEHHGDEEVKENIGLSNLRRQLVLLYTDYSLNVQQSDSYFTAILKINLASHV